MRIKISEIVVNKNFDNTIVQEEIDITKNLNTSIIDEVKMYFKKYMDLDASVNKKALELNQKNMEVKKRLIEKFVEKKISIYEMELIKEYSENLADSNEEIKRRKLMELEEKRRLLVVKKNQNERIMKIKEFFETEKEKHIRLQEEYESQLKDRQRKVKHYNLKFNL